MVWSGQRDREISATEPRRRNPVTDDGRSQRGYGRVLGKQGGEMFGGGRVRVGPDVVGTVAGQMAEVVAARVEVAIVIGGGTFFRGAELQQRGMERARGAYMAMLGSVMNCLALQDFL